MNELKETGRLDSLSHPDFDNSDSVFTLIESYKKHRFRGAIAVPDPFKFKGSNVEYCEKCRSTNFFFTAWLYQANGRAPIQTFESAVEHQAIAVKIHPRCLSLDLFSPRGYGLLISLFEASVETGLPIYFCTFWSDSLDKSRSIDPIGPLSQALHAVPATRIVLLHGGGVNFLNYIELARFNENVLLDLSFTFMKYQGSSVMQDIFFALSTFDNRICFGTDSPYYDLRDSMVASDELLRRCETDFSENRLEEKVWSKNLRQFLRL